MFVGGFGFRRDGSASERGAHDARGLGKRERVVDGTGRSGSQRYGRARALVCGRLVVVGVGRVAPLPTAGVWFLGGLLGGVRGGWLLVHLLGSVPPFCSGPDTSVSGRSGRGRFVGRLCPIGR